MTMDPIFGPFFWGFLFCALCADALRNRTAWMRILVGAIVYVVSSQIVQHFYVVIVRL